jgi:hypothetical protein
VLATRHVLRSLVSFALVTGPLAAQDSKPVPDELEMSDGTSLRGLILKNTADTVLLQTSTGEISVPKSSIRRIREEADRDIYLSQVTARGKLPSWNAIVHDFRDHDAVWRLEIIPSAAITTGEFRNIPYLSFVVNKQAKLNILGNPADPVGIQFAIFGKKGRSAKYHQIVREFLAGHLHTRKEIAALYSLSARGDRKQAGRLAFLVTPPESPDAHGAWALTIYDPSRLAAARVPDGKYAALTRPFGEIHRRDGTINPSGTQRLDQWLVSSVMSLPSQIPKIRGFQRDENGVFQILRLQPSP